MSESLFRKEVLNQRSDRLYGEVHIFGSSRWTIVFSLIVILCTLFVVGATTVKFSKSVSIRGVIGPERGVALVAMPKSGVLTHLYARQGEMVRAGGLAAIISTDQILANGISSAEAEGQKINNQLIQIDSQIRNGSLTADIDANSIREAAGSLEAAIRQINRQIDLQIALVVQGEQAKDRADGLASKGYITNTYLDATRETLLLRKQRLSELQLTLSEKTQALADLRSRSSLGKVATADALAKLTAQREDLKGLSLQNNLSGQYGVRFPTTGIVGNIHFREGASVNGGGVLMDLIPSRDKLIVRLQIPPTSVASIKPGQQIRVFVDSIPSQTFGTLNGSIYKVSSTVTLDPTVDARTAYYTGYASIDEKATNLALLKALRPDMTGTVAVATGRMSMLGWFLQSFSMRSKP